MGKSVKTGRTIRLQSAFKIWERNLRTYRNKWHYSFLPNFFQPIFYLVAIGVGLGAYVGEAGDFEQGYLAFIAPGLVAASAMNGAAFETTYNLYVKTHIRQLYDAMVTTRISMEDVIFGEMLWAVTRSFIYGLIFLLVTFFFGVPLNWYMLLAPVAIVLTGFCFTAIGMAFTSCISNIDLFTYYFTIFITPLFLFSDIFFPVGERFPDSLVIIAQATPLYHGVQLLRGLAEADLSSWPLSGLYLIVVGVIFFIIALKYLKGRVVY